jgi:magnesium-transporting ATPase (P-type)
VARNQRHHGWRILLAQFTSPLILVLIGAAIVSRYLGESVEATVIMGIVVVNAALGFVQEYRAERALRALQRFVTHSATVRRAGTLADVPPRISWPGTWSVSRSATWCPRTCASS